MNYLKNKWVWIVLSLLFIVGVALYIRSSSDKSNDESITLQKRTIEHILLISGKIASSQEVNIKSELGGIVEEIFVKSGDKVSVRTPLARLRILPDPKSNQDADRQISNAKASLARVEAAYKRNKALYDQDVISRQEYEQSLQEYQMAKNDLNAANNFKKIVNQGYANSSDFVSNIVYSTTNGIVLEIPVKVGGSVINRNTFNEGTTIATIANTSEFIFKGQVNESDLAQLAVGKELNIKITALRNQKFKGTISKISPKGVDVGGITKFDVEAVISLSPAELAQMRSGYSATAHIVLEKVENAWAVEEKYIVYSADSTFVWIQNDDKPQKKPVELGLSDGQYIQVIKGISPKDKIILKLDPSETDE